MPFLPNFSGPIQMIPIVPMRTLEMAGIRLRLPEQDATDSATMGRR